jgi:hypothetical protein
MRTLILALTVLLFAAPVWATVTITAEMDDSDPNKIWIGYTSDEAELIRAFALDITVEDGNIVAVEDYAVGDDNGGYGIFPGSFAAAPIQVDPGTGLVVTWDVADYSPVAPAGDPDALGGIGTDGVTIEMGSLYDTLGPNPTEGILCSVTVDENASKLCVTANAIRGNVVLESAAEVQSLNLPEGEDCLDIPPRGGPDCFPSDDQEAYDAWVSFGKPDCWCYAKQCYGDADGYLQGSTIFGLKYVSTDDLIILASAWQINEPPKGDGIADIPNGICADFDHKAQGSSVFGLKRVSTDDLIILANYWQINEPPKGDGVPAADCVPVPVDPPPKP